MRLPTRSPLRKAALLSVMRLDREVTVGRHVVKASDWYTQTGLARHGGSRFPARLFELARENPTLTYDCRCVDDDTGQYVYRLRERYPGEPMPQRRVSRVKQLEAEVERLRAELAKTKESQVSEPVACTCGGVWLGVVPPTSCPRHGSVSLSAVTGVAP